MKPITWLIFALSGPLCASISHADLNKCQDASGRVTYTDQPCPSTMPPAKRVVVPPLPKVDVSGLPRDARGRPIVGQMGDSALVLEKRDQPGPANALAACSTLVTRCYQPGTRELDDCVASTPRCATSRPWEETPFKPCCSEACVQAYRSQRQAGAAPLKALDQALFGGGVATQGCLPLQ
jgi:hypothetical protein